VAPGEEELWFFSKRRMEEEDALRRAASRRMEEEFLEEEERRRAAARRMMIEGEGARVGRIGAPTDWDIVIRRNRELEDWIRYIIWRKSVVEGGAAAGMDTKVVESEYSRRRREEEEREARKAR